MAKMLTTVKIDSITVDDYLISYDIEKTRGYFITEGNFELVRTANSVVDFNTGLTVEVWRGTTTATDKKIFSGYIESFQPDGGIIKVIAKDKLWNLVRGEVTQIYDPTIDAFGGKISAIFTDLVTTYGGLNADGSTVQDSGTVKILEKFECNHADIYDRCKELSQAIDWQFYYNADDDYVYFEPLGFTSNATPLVVGGNVITIPKWNIDNTEMANDITITGASQLLQTVETGQIGVTAGYTTSSIELTFELNDIIVVADAANPPTTVREGGIAGSTAAGFYYSVDNGNKRILPATSFTNNWYFEITYSYKTPVPVHMYSQSSKDEFGTFKKTFTFNDIKTVEDAQTRGRKVLEKYSQPFVYTKLKVSPNPTYDVGQLVTVVDEISIPNVNQTFVISKIVFKYPASYDEISIGDKEWRLSDWQGDVMVQLKRLQEEQFQNQGIVVELVDVDTSQNNSVEVQPRYFKAETETVSGVNVFILSHTSYGVLGTNELGNAGIADPVKASLFQYQNSYEETFYSTDFEETTTTADWASAALEFDNAEIAVSKSIDYNNGTITTAKMTATAPTPTEAAHYLLNDDAASTTVLDTTGNFNGTCSVNTDTINDTGKINGALHFNGSGNKVTLPASNSIVTNNTNWSICCWANADTIHATNYRQPLRLCSSGTSACAAFDIGQVNKAFYRYRNSGGTAVPIELGTIAAGTWYFLCMTYDGTTYRGYLNAGTPVLTVADFIGFGAVAGQIGGVSSTTWFDGLVDDARIYRHTLTADEITAIYNAGTGTEAENISFTPTSSIFTYYLTANGGSNWETVTNGTAHTFANTGTDLRWKIVYSGATTRIISRIDIIDYH